MKSGQELQASSKSLNELIVSGRIPISREWEPLKDVLRQVSEKVEIQEQIERQKFLRKEASRIVFKTQYPFYLILIAGFAPLIAAYISFFGAAFLSACLFTIIGMIIISIGSHIIGFNKQYRDMLNGDIPANLDYKQIMRNGALQTADKSTHEALSHAFDDAFILMDELAPDENSELSSAAMQSIRQTLGSMIIAGAIVKRIDQYLKTRPDHVKRSAKRADGNMGEEVELYRELSSDQVELLNNLEIARERISVLRGTILQLQSDKAKELLANDTKQAMDELERAQEAAFTLDINNQQISKKLDLQSAV